MELYDNMMCKFTSVSTVASGNNEEVIEQHTVARYFNQTHIGCLIPTYDEE